MHRHLICYDIVSDRRRRRMARLLEGHGHRMHESAFTVNLNPSKLGRLKRRMALIVHPVDDHVVIYPLCERDQADIQHLGRSTPPQASGSVVV